MTWTLLCCLAVVLGLGLAVAFQRRADLRRQRLAVAERSAMARRQNDTAPLVVPVIDLQKCLGCGTCVRSCPEDGVLDLVHGQAAVVNAAQCVGHARCVAECPVGAVTLGSGDLTERDDVPVLDGDLAAVGTPGLYLVGEITAKALIRPATEQGARVARAIGQVRGEASGPPGVHDLVVIGAGPGGLACALGAIEQGLDLLVLDQEPAIGGTVAKYPRRKLVLTEPIDLPLHGRIEQREFEKEQLIRLWQRLAREHDVPFRGGVTFERCERLTDGTFRVHTDDPRLGELRAHHVVLAVGRRGQPRRLGIPGEDLPHVAYSLLDAGAFEDCEIVVVGGGDSAVEAAMALSDQAGNRVTIVYRQDQFFRIRRKNQDRLQQRLAENRLQVVFRHEPTAITETAITIVSNDGSGAERQIRADQVFVMVGGEPPFPALQSSGVSFDHSTPEAIAATAAPDAGNQAAADRSLLPVLGGSAILTIATFAFALWHLDYYSQTAALRAADPKHALLRPDQSLGLWFGIVSVMALLANLAYLLRRRLTLTFGTLTGWMDAHIVTGVAALLLASLHGAMAPRSTPGGHAFWALAALVVTGAIGRWFYAWLPRAANGRELDLAAIRDELRGQQANATAGTGFGNAAQHETEQLLDRRQWRSTFFGRALTLLGLSWDLNRTLRRLRHVARTEGVSPNERNATFATIRSAYRTSVAASHLEDLRAVLATWRWLHRWLALLLMLLITVHVVMAWLHGAFSFGGGR